MAKPHLYDIYHEHWKANPPPADKPLPATRRHVADNSDKLAAIRTGATRVKASNFKYKSANAAGPHGRSVITTYTLIGAEGKSKRLTDFDDADTELVAKWAAWAKADPAERRPNVAIMPHHGTGLERTDIRPLLEPEIRPLDVVFTVNEYNRFLHPRPETVRYCLYHLGKDHVHFTAGADNVRVTHDGLLPTHPDEPPLYRFLRVLTPKMLDVGADVTHLAQRGIDGPLSNPATTTVAQCYRSRRK